MNKTPRFAKIPTTLSALAAGLLLSSHAGAATILSDADDAAVTVSTGGAQTSSVGSTSTTSNVGRQGTDLRGNAVYVFQLPDFGTAVNPFTQASFTFNYRAINGGTALPDADLYGLARRSTSTVLLSDFYHGANDAANDRLQQSVLTTATTIGLVTTSTGGNTALLSFLNSEYAGGAGAGDFVFLRLNLNTTAGVGGSSRYNVGLSELGDANVAEINYEAVPEPSIALLSVIGTLLMAGRRRR